MEIYISLQPFFQHLTYFSITTQVSTMARVSAFNIFTISILCFLLAIHFTQGEEDDQYEFVQAIHHKALISLGEEKLSHLRFFWHDTQSGRNPSSIKVVKSPSQLPDGFGSVNMIDNPLTLGPKLSSKIVGRAQGFYASASQEELALLMTMDFAFLEGKYNRSSITVLGRNPVLDKVREMPVIGGSGVFRFARGFAQAKTYWFDKKAGDAIVEYNIYVIHY